MRTMKLLLLNGSPRKNGTSFSFARTLKKLAEEEGHNVKVEHVIDYFEGRKEISDLKAQLAKSDIIGLIAPLYVDTLPYPTISFLEMIAAEGQQELKGKGFFAIAQSGFPDIKVCKPILETSECFADELGMKWLGGLAYGGGAMLDGALLEESGKKGSKITSGFKMALEDVLQLQMISSLAQERIEVRIPQILYRPLAALMNHLARKQAKKAGASHFTRKVY